MRSFKCLPYVLAVSALTTFHSFPTWAEGDVLEVQHQGNISYVSGGIGSEESAALEAVQRNYDLRIMSSDKTGHFSGDTHVVISDLQHHKLLDTTGGPLFYINLPNGRYVVEAFSEGQSKKQVVTISGSKPARIHFIWQVDPADAIKH